jgi:hypothetical protein
MSGKIIGIVILLSALVAGVALYYLQVYGFYETLERDEVTLVTRESDAPEVIEIADFEGIDADSSPIRYRACFSTDLTPEAAAERFVPLDGVTPRNAPGWFDCFDAEALGGRLEAGTARAFLGAKNVAYGVDRIVALTPEGRGYVWHELNDCGEKAYDGTVVGEECPPLPQPATD